MAFEEGMGRRGTDMVDATLDASTKTAKTLRPSQSPQAFTVARKNQPLKHYVNRDAPG